MIRILFGPDVKDYQELEKELSETKSLYAVSEEKRRSAEAGWRSARAELENLSKYCDDLDHRFRELRAENRRMHEQWNQALVQGVFRVEQAASDAPTVPAAIASAFKAVQS